jgi:hypothetical protein
MKITKSQLQQIIKEELQTEMDASQEGRDESFQDVMTDAGYSRLIQLVETLLRENPEDPIAAEMNAILSGTWGY